MGLEIRPKPTRGAKGREKTALREFCSSVSLLDGGGGCRNRCRQRERLVELAINKFNSNLDAVETMLTRKINGFL